MVKRLRIAIDPELKRRYGPEICWTWRFLLAGMGFAWEEVLPQDPACDIAYLTSLPPGAKFPVYISAQIANWQNKERPGSISEESGEDLVYTVFRLLSGQDEELCAKDKHGHLTLNGSGLKQKENFLQGTVSQIAAVLEKKLQALNFESLVSRWPAGKTAAFSVSHDVDYPQVIRWLEPVRILQRQGLSGLNAILSVLDGKRHHWQFSSWVALEKALGIESVFYFAAREGSLLEYLSGKPDPFYDIHSQDFTSVFRLLKDEGFEIGLHASYCAFADKDKFAAEKKNLEQVSGTMVYGNRHHYLHLDPHNPEDTLLLHEQLNFQYDASLQHERYVGWRRSSSWPFYPFHRGQRRQLQVLQLPVAWMDNQLFGYSKDNPGSREEMLRALANRAAEQGGHLFVNIHDYVFDEQLFPGWRGIYQKLLGYIIERNDFWFAAPHKIAEHWNNRYNRIVKESYGLSEGN